MFFRFKKFIWIFSIPLSIIACSDSENDSPLQPSEIQGSIDSDREDFVLVKAKGANSFVGSFDASAKASERPLMEVTFSYDFSIGVHEVTCGEFARIMKQEFEKQYSDFKCEKDSLPVANVTFYDAVLFANARSKKDKADSVYSYSGISFDNEGHCTHLEGFAFHPEIKGYRLPTEAEWILAASQDWSVKNSWNADNSDFKVHKICSQKKNGIGLCDMAGNLMEWVNDWKGNFKDTAITNFVGAPDGGSLGERIVKGGSFRSEPDAINTFSRGDVYTVTSSTKANYVGFRLAFGGIPSPTWLSNSGTVSSSRIIPVANLTALKKLTGTTKLKLAFRNDVTGNLALIDFTAGTLTVKEFNDSIPVYHPEISPDGNWVAFCTNIEGAQGKTRLYVRNIKNNSATPVQLNVESAAIPRWQITANGDTVINYVSSAADNSDKASFSAASTWQVRFSKGKFGTPKKIFDGAYHGGVSADNKFAVTGSKLLRAINKNADTVWYNGEQACNVSLSKDNRKKTLFLDFGGKTGREFSNKKYRTHEMILVADSTGKLIQAIPAPEKSTFDHSEWTYGNLIVATLANINGAHEKIVLINPADTSITPLVEGDELWHPSLWIKENNVIKTELDLDSAGQYFTVGGSEAALCLRNKMQVLWEHRDAKLAILGSSRPLNGIKPSLLNDTLEAINLANVPNSIYVSDYLLRNYLLKHLDKLKYVLVSLDIDMWWKIETKSADNFFLSEYRQYPGFAYDEDHDFWEGGIPEGLLEGTQSSFNFDVFDSIYIPSRGFGGEPDNSWEEKPAVDYDSTWFDKDPDLFYDNFHKLESMIAAAAEHNVILIGVIFPMSPGFKKTGSFGRYGIRRSQAPKLIQEIGDLSKKYSNFILLDENKMGDHDYTDSMASNRDHLSISGAKQFTKRLDSLIASGL